MDKIIIHNAMFTVKLGVLIEERNRQQEIDSTITVYADTKNAGKSDNIKDTLSCEDIYRQTKIAAECRPYSTLEAMADNIFRQLQANLTFHSVTIQLRKSGTMIRKDLGYLEWAGVEITRTWDAGLEGP